MTAERSNADARAVFPIDGKVRDDFDQALEAAALRSYGSIEELRASLCKCVKQLRQDGMTPEGTILTMRAYMRHAAKTRLPPSVALDPAWALASISDKLAEWCLDAYFSDT